MASKEIKICDCCKKEHETKSDRGRNYGNVLLSFKSCYHLQTDYSQELCGLCAALIERVVTDKLNELKRVNNDK